MRMMSTISPERFWPMRPLTNNQMDYMFGDFEKIIDELMQKKHEGGQSFQPKCEVSETKEHFLASFDIPGIKKEDLKIELKANQISISGERRHIVNQKFERTFNLPMTVNTEKIMAQHEDGVLTIVIPKAVEEQGRIIPIQGVESKVGA